MSAGAASDGRSPDARLVHDLANPLSAVLAEAQLLLLDADKLSPDTVASLRAIEAAALKMRAILKDTSARRP